MVRYLVAAFFLLYPPVHGGYEPTPQTPGMLSWWKGKYGSSWLLSALHVPHAASRAIGAVLWVGPMAGLVAAGLAVLGIIVPTDWWETLAVASAAGSLLLAVLFWHPWQWISALVDLAILVILLRTDWGSHVV